MDDENEGAVGVADGEARRRREDVKTRDKLRTGVIILVDTSFPCALPRSPTILSSFIFLCILVLDNTCFHTPLSTSNMLSSRRLS